MKSNVIQFSQFVFHCYGSEQWGCPLRSVHQQQCAWSFRSLKKIVDLCLSDEVFGGVKFVSVRALWVFVFQISSCIFGSFFNI
ncbi:hypothetical protein L208DRAFT_788413 [Tricholoma matsutake]|nr:hypothetical protein L208DRAFT_788413 [Tricholoma matsutake 945]